MTASISPEDKGITRVARTVAQSGTARQPVRYIEMVGLVLIAALQAASAEPASLPANPRAVELFERDWVLNQWAKQRFDKNGDGAISIDEAQPAARAFKEIADGDRDGRVTPYEYQRAREFILARY